MTLSLVKFVLAKSTIHRELLNRDCMYKNMAYTCTIGSM